MRVGLPQYTAESIFANAIYTSLCTRHVIMYMMYESRVRLGFWQKDTDTRKDTLQKVHAKRMILTGNEGETLRNN